MSDELKFACVFVLVVVLLGRWVFGPRKCGECDGSGIYGEYPCQWCGGKGIR